MCFDFSIKTLRLILNLYKKYVNNSNNLTPSEYCENAIVERNNIKETEVQLLYNFIRHANYMQSLVSEFAMVYNLKPKNTNLIAFLLYVVIFEFDVKNLPQTINFFNSCHDIYRMYYRIPMFFERDECLAIIARTGCQYFDQAYILENVVQAIYNKYEALLELISQIEVFMNKPAKESNEDLTKTNAPSFLAREHNKKIKIDDNTKNVTQQLQHKFEPKDPPRTTYERSKEIEINLIKESQKNRDKALRLLKLAQTDAFKCANKPKPKPLAKPPKIFAIKRKNYVPAINNAVDIKTNTSFYLRQASTIAKEHIGEIKRLEELCSGSGYCNVKQLEDEIRKDKQQQMMQDIERKHLQGLLTREEAVIAKKNLYKQNQAKMERFKMEREEILQEIESWKKQEEEKLKLLVEKSQNIVKAAREAEKKLLEKKQENVKNIDEEKRRLLHDAYKKKQEELAEKVKLIQELRALNQLKQIEMKDAKEFDPTECSNFGLMCEMSIAELRERLTLMKVEIKENLEKRRRIIMGKKMKRQDHMDKVKEFITQSKAVKRDAERKISPVKLQETPEILALRQKLEMARIAKLQSIKL